MSKKQKPVRKLWHFASKTNAHEIVRGSILLLSFMLVLVAVFPHHNVSTKQPLPRHTTVTKTSAHHVSKQAAAATKPAPVPAPQVAVTPPTPAPAPVPRPAPVAPKVVVAAPTSSVSGLTPTSSSTPTTSSSGGSTSTSTGSSGSTSTSSSSSSTPPVGYSSTNWSGYMSTSSTYTYVTAAWVVPSVSGNGTSTTADGTWIGIGGVTTSDLIQTGTQDTVGANGNVSTSAFYEMLPQASVTIQGIPVAPGDSVDASISEVSAGTWTITFADVTSNKTYTLTVTYASSNSSAEWIEEDPSYSNGNLVPFDHFGSVTFSGGTTTAQGSSLTIAGSNASPITLVNSSGQPIAIPSSLTANGEGFTVTQQ